MAQNQEVKVVLASDLSEEHFDTTNTDRSNKIKVKFPSDMITGLTFQGNKLKFNKNGSPQELDLASLAADVHATGATYNPTNTTLTITKNQGGNITVDLGKLAESSVGNDSTSAVTLSGNGKQGTPLKADVKLGRASNLLKKSGTGELSVSEDDVRRVAREVAGTGVDALDTITLKNAFGTRTLGTVYAKPSRTA